MKLSVALGLFLLLGLSMNALAAPDEDTKLDAFFKEFLEAAFKTQPMFATALGDHRFDSQLDDLTPAARAANLKMIRDTLSELPRKVVYDKLSRNGQIDFEIFRHYLEREIWLDDHFKPFEDDPRVYGPFLTDCVYMPLTQSTLPPDKNLANITARMAHIPSVVDVARSTIKNPPKIRVETAIRQTEGAISFYRQELFTLTGKAPGEGELGERAEAVAKALTRHVAFLKDEVLPRSTDAWRIGPKLFAEKLEYELDAGLSAVEVLAEAKAEADRVEREMAIVARLLWPEMFPGKVVPPDDAEGRRTMTAAVLAEIAKDHGTPESLVKDAKSTVAEIKQFIRKNDILALPDPDRCRILEMPEFKRGVSVAYLESAPPLDPQGASEYAISPPPSDWDAKKVESYLGEYNKAMLKVLTIHEAYPGHYVQLEYANRCPSLIRKVLSSGTFAEGWAVYTEKMMLDQGFGGGDLRLRLQQMKFYLRAVMNAILDHEMHAGSMTDAQALDLLVNRAFQTEGEALGKIIRSKLTSCQLSTYFVGRTAFHRLRQSVQREQGDKFSLGRYHEAALSHGTLPVKYLPELVRKMK
jgi:uncharacterized protein (DUF885 family)